MEQDRQQLPVAARPAVHPRRGDVGVERRVLHDRDVGDRGTAGQRAFEQVVAQHLALRQTPAEHRVHGLDVEQALAGERALAEQVLVDLGAGDAVRVDAALAGEQPVVKGHLLGRAQGSGDVRLQDAVAVLDAPAVGREARPVVRMRGDADEVAEAPGRQPGVAVEREHVAHAGPDRGDPAQVDEGAGRIFGQHPEQLFELAALPLPADPALLRFGEAAFAVQQDEAGRFAFVDGIERIQPFDRLHRRVEQYSVVRRVLRVRVGPVAEQRELNPPFRIGEVVQLQQVRQRRARFRLGQHGRDDDHRPVLRRDAGREGEARQVAGSRRLADQPVDDGDGRFGSRKQHQDRGERCQPGCNPRRQCGAVAQQQPGDDDAGRNTDRAEVGRQGDPAQAGLAPPRLGLAQAERRQQPGLARAEQPVRRHALGIVAAPGRIVAGAMHQAEQGLGHRALAPAALLGQLLDAVQSPVAGVVALGGEGRRAQHQLGQHAGLGDDVGPVGVADRAQRGDRVADAQVVGGLRRRQPGLDLGQVRRDPAQPVERHLLGLGPRILQALRHLRQKGLADAAPVQQGQQGVEPLGGVGVEAVAAQVGDLARGLVRGHALGQPAQVLDQHDPQGRRQRPQFSERELARFLVSLQEVDQQLFVEGAVGVRDERPGDAVDARQPDQRLVLQHRQVAEVPPRQAVVDFAQLRFDQVKVVEQPLGRRADVVAGGRLLADVAMRFAQDPDVVAQARKERGRTGSREAGGVRFAEAASVLREALRTEDLRAVRSLERATRGIENRAYRCRRIGHQPQQFERRHRGVRR